MVNKSQLEDLPDEIVIEICFYLNQFDILYSFINLNQRLQCTISEFRQHLDFSSFSLSEFERITCPYLFNYISEGLIKLILSNECASGQIELFEKTLDNQSFQNKFPFLKSLKFIEFTNDNKTISSKILFIQELYLEFSVHENMTKETENILISSIFNTNNNLEKIKLNIHCGVKINSELGINKKLKEINIQLNNLNDFLTLLKIAPNLTHVQVGIYGYNSSINIPEDEIGKNVKELYFIGMSKEIMPFKRILIPFICKIPSIEYLCVGVRSDDPDYVDAKNWIDFINSMPNLNAFIMGLEIDITENLIHSLNINTVNELKEEIFNSFSKYLSSYPVSIYTNTKKLFIDSIPYRFNRDQYYTTSPQAAHALNTDIDASRRSSSHIVGVTMDGEHILTNKNDYLYVISKFSNIKWLCLNLINIINQNERQEKEEERICLKLKNLKTLIYLRSTLCKVNRNLFDKLFYGHEKLDTLKITYGDLIYLLRSSSPPINGNHIKNLILSCYGADGRIRVKYLDYLLITFPYLEHISIDVSSINLIKKNQIEIINYFVLSFKNLRSLKIISRKGQLKFVCSLMESKEKQVQWLNRVNATNSHLILKPKSLSVWKNDYLITYF